jgi:uncharacterized coiled-coil protein SlyX
MSFAQMHNDYLDPDRYFGEVGEDGDEFDTAVDTLQQEVERLRNELCLIGDLAISQWDDAVVGKVDAATKPPATYKEWARSIFAQVQEVERLHKAGTDTWAELRTQLHAAEQRTERAEAALRIVVEKLEDPVKHSFVVPSKQCMSDWQLVKDALDAARAATGGTGL